MIAISDSDDSSTNYDSDTMGFTAVTDGETTTLTYPTLDTAAAKTQVVEDNTSGDDNHTMTDISTLMSSKLHGSEILQKHDEAGKDGAGRSKKRHEDLREQARQAIDEALAQAKSKKKGLRNKKIKKKKSRRRLSSMPDFDEDDDATLESVEVTMFQDPYILRKGHPPSPSCGSKPQSGSDRPTRSRSRRNSKDKENDDIPTEILERRVGAPSQLKRFVSKRLGSRRNNSYNEILDEDEDIAVVLAMAMSKPTKLRTQLYNEDEEDVPFDEPL
ncbi:MAG: hypothetical protein SGARI_002534, partial [Bacillariaceae sp.]